MSLRPLAGARVLDATTGVAGSVCAKLLAEAGAAVTRLEHAQGDPAAVPNPAGGGDSWLEFLNAEKRLVAVDASSREESANLERLLATSHAYLTSAPHAGASPDGLDCESVLSRHPELFAACITPFGQSGPRAGDDADDVILSALSGLADATPGYPDRQDRDDDPPVQALAPLAEMAGGLTAACAVFGHVVSRLRGRDGPRHLEVATLEAATSMMIFEWGATTYGGKVHGRRPSHEFPEPNCYVPCADRDAVLVAFRDAHWQILVELMGNPDWATDPAFSKAAGRTEHRDRLHQHLRSWAATQPGPELVADAQSRGLPCSAWLELSETVSSEHVRALGSVETRGSRVFPADPIVVNGERRGTPPQPPEPTGLPDADGRGSLGGDSPLAGIRVLDLTHIVAGPFCGQLLAALGAEVILVESATYAVSRSFGPFVGEPWYDGSMMFNHANRGKVSVEIDLTLDSGRRLLLELVKSADVVIENLSTQAAERLGLTYPELSKAREDLVLGSISGFGRTGPWGTYVAFHSGVILMSGLASATRDEAGRPRITGSIYPDLLAGTYAALAVQQALAQRDLSGDGCHVEVSMLDVLLFCMGGLVPAAADGATPAPRQGCFVKTAEPGGFLAVADSGPTVEPDLREAAAHQTRQEALDSLRARGIRAAPVIDMSEIMSDPHLTKRGFVLPDDHPIAGSRPVPGVPWLVDGTRPTLRHAPRRGDRTDEVLGLLAQLEPEALDALRAEGVLT